MSEPALPQLSYEIDGFGGPTMNRLPFVVAVIGDLSGRRPMPLAERRFLGGRAPDIEALLAFVRPRIELEVEDRLGDGSPLWAELVFEALEDFEPDGVVRQVPRLACRLNFLEFRARNDDGSVAAQLDGLLHHPRFQQMEGAWRGLADLCGRMEGSELAALRVLDATKKELLEDLAGNSALDRLLRQEFAAYEFGPDPCDRELLERLTALGASVHAPFLCSASSAVLARPRFRVREPYENRRLLDSPYCYTESGNVPWGNPAFALAGSLVESFLRSGWWLGLEPAPLAALLNASRVAHYVAKLAGDLGRRSMKREDLESLLNTWIGGWFSEPGAERLWREAKLRVEESPEPGRFRAVLELLPPSGADARIRLAIDLPSPAA